MRDCSFCRIACCGTRKAFCSPASTRTFANCPRQPFDSWIGEFGTQLHGAELGVDGGRREIELAVVGNDRVGVVHELHARSALGAADAIEVRLGEREAHPDGIHLGERGEQARIRVRGDEAPLGALRAPGDARDRRRDFRIGEVELGFLQLGLRSRDGSRGGASRRDRGVVVALRDGLLLREGLEALGVGLGQVAFHALLLQRRFRPVHRELERGGVDQEEELARLDGSALFVGALLDDAGHPRADLHVARALGLADRLQRDRHALLRDLHGGDGERAVLRGGRGLGGFVVLVAGGHGKGKQEDGEAARERGDGDHRQWGGSAAGRGIIYVLECM
ncbi:MAG TPA: hypothetical protein VLL50_00860 [Usitatibacter sp.]|nr:hypothetical protein [Usitatibacter sp.]